MLRDYIKIALENIRLRRLRSFLTALGVVISVASIIMLVVLGNGLNLAIQEQFAKMGSNRLEILGKGASAGLQGGLLTSKDTKALEALPYFQYVTPMMVVPGGDLVYHKVYVTAYLEGMPTSDFAKRFGDYDFQLEQGRLLSNNDKSGVLIGYDIWDKGLDRRLQVNSNVLIHGQTFRVIGILKPIGNSQDDNSVIMNIDSLRALYDRPNEVDVIDAQIKPSYDPEVVAEKVTDYLKRKRGDDNFEVFTAKQILSFLTTILGAITFILSAIAFISLIVGAIGIMNSMFTNVLERTNEIGIMKSIGAQRRDILTIFLVESGLIGFLGGIVGVAIGQTGAYFVGQLINSTGFLPILITIDYPLLGGALLFAMGIGVLAGALPSYRASRMPPVEALRYD